MLSTLLRVKAALAAKLCLKNRTRGHFILAGAAVWWKGFVEQRHPRPVYGCRLGQFMPVVTDFSMAITSVCLAS
jgi:hypothetical protein